MTKKRKGKVVWLVGVSDCEGNSIKCICATKPIAERELFKARDELVEEYKKMDAYSENTRKEFCKKQGIPYFKDDMYKKMISNLQGSNYEKWDNYPHDRPYLCQLEIKES